MDRYVVISREVGDFRLPTFRSSHPRTYISINCLTNFIPAADEDISDDLKSIDVSWGEGPEFAFRAGDGDTFPLGGRGGDSMDSMDDEE